MSWVTGHTVAWEQQYSAGRYLGEPPDPFISDVIGAARTAAVRDGLDIGCGNGRNLIPLLHAGIAMTGIDISATGIGQLRSHHPQYSDRVSVATVSDLPPTQRFDLVTGIQVFMFGSRAQAHEHLCAAQERVRPGGLLALRTNAVGTDVWPAHEVIETHPDTSFTVTYLAGAKCGLQVHFFAEEELAALFAGWEPVLALRRDRRDRANGQGQWTQFEGIWRRPQVKRSPRTGGAVKREQ